MLIFSNDRQPFYLLYILYVTEPKQTIVTKDLSAILANWTEGFEVLQPTPDRSWFQQILLFSCAIYLFFIFWNDLQPF